MATIVIAFIILLICILRSFRSNPIINLTAVAISCVLLWRGIWNLADYCDATSGVKSLLLSGTLSIVVGLAINYLCSISSKDALFHIQEYF